MRHPVTLPGYHARPEESAAIAAMMRPTGRIRAALLEGVPGCGKTALAEAVARGMDCPYIYTLLHSWSDDQELFCGVDVAAAVAGESAHVRQHGVLAIAAEKSQTSTVVLCLDEVDKVQERTEFLLLDFLQTGRVPVRPGLHLQAQPDNLLVFLTSNATRPLSDPLLRRVRRVRMRPLPAEQMVALATAQSGAPAGVVRLLYKAAVRVAEADTAVLTLQELASLAGDVWHVARSCDEAREYLRQWAARGDAGAAAATHIDLAPLWGEVQMARRRGSV